MKFQAIPKEYFFKTREPIVRARRAKEAEAKVALKSQVEV